MNLTTLRHGVIRFGQFEVDLQSGELRKAGLKIKLREQSFQILVMLLERPGEVITREELRQRLWPEGTFVDFDHSLNAAINRLREVLDDSAEQPRYVETLPRRGYRFIAPVEALTPGPSPRGSGEQAEKLVGLTPQGSGEKKSDSQPSPPGRGWPPEAGTGEGAVAPTSSPETVAPLDDRRLVEESKRPAAIDRRYSRRLARAGAVLLAVVGIILALNVGGLRDRLSTAVGAGSARPREGRALPYPKIESIAVLPLENLSGDPTQEYFADGVTEELITSLGKISALRVISRTSVMRYKETKKPLPEIAKELNVDALVEGAVLRSGDRVRITANLIHASTDRHLWAEAYDRDLRDVLALQSEVAQAIAREVQVKLTPQETTRLARARPSNPQAYEAYFKGQFELRQFNLYRALGFFQKAVEIDPNFAPAYVGLARTNGYLGEIPLLPAVEAGARAKSAALRAVELDGSNAEAHAALASSLVFADWDWSGADREFRIALKLNPNSAGAHTGYAQYLEFVGRTPEALAEGGRGLEVDPLSPFIHLGVGALYIFNRQYDLALNQYQRAVKLDPGQTNFAWFAGVCYREKGMFRDAIPAFLELREPYRDSPASLGHLGNTYARAGDHIAARRIIQKLAEKSAKESLGTYEVALVYTGLGDKDSAFKWLEKAYLIRDKGMCYLKVDPALDPLRSDPRFQDLLRRMNFPP